MLGIANHQCHREYTTTITRYCLVVLCHHLMNFIEMFTEKRELWISVSLDRAPLPIIIEVHACEIAYTLCIHQYIMQYVRLSLYICWVNA